MITIYGIRNCDTVRKARRWLTDKGVDHHFHDLRTDGLDRKTLSSWMDRLHWQDLLNRRGTTWRKLPETDRANVDDHSAVDLMLKHVTLIKRPIVRIGTAGPVVVGFSPEDWELLLDV
ncbi:MAG: ArsC family reductase [Gammaproteobacteria bacterium]